MRSLLAAAARQCNLPMIYGGNNWSIFENASRITTCTSQNLLAIYISQTGSAEWVWRCLQRGTHKRRLPKNSPSSGHCIAWMVSLGSSNPALPGVQLLLVGNWAYNLECSTPRCVVEHGAYCTALVFSFFSSCLVLCSKLWPLSVEMFVGAWCREESTKEP